MNLEAVAQLVIDALWVSVCVSGPILLLTTIIGLGISLMQALTQVNESSIAFIAKLLASIVVVVVAGSWMLSTLVAFVTRTIETSVR